VVIEQSVERWLVMLERNRETWLAAIASRGLSRDPELEAILEEAREQAADRLIEALQTYEASQAPDELRATVRAYSGFAEAASVEWLLRERLTRPEIKALLIQGFLSIVRDVLPAVEKAKGEA
jgi:AcrR family transcriptional regulator